MALPPKTIESIEQIAEKLERWANNRKRHKMLCNALPGLGCRTSLNEPLRGFGTILLKLKCWRPEAAKEVEKEHIRLLLAAKEIDKKIVDGHRNFFFLASTLQLCANLLVKKLRTVAEMAREDLLLATEKNKRRSKNKPKKSRAINKRFSFRHGQVLFDDHDLNVGAGAALDIIKALVKDFGHVVSFQKLDENSPKGEASEKIRTAIGRIRKTIKSAMIPVVIENRKAEGYIMLPLTK